MNLDEQREEAKAISERLEALRNARTADAHKLETQQVEEGCERQSIEENVAGAIDSDLFASHSFLREALKCKEWI
jgi:hypothetical protein